MLVCFIDENLSVSKKNNRSSSLRRTTKQPSSKAFDRRVMFRVLGWCSVSSSRVFGILIARQARSQPQAGLANQTAPTTPTTHTTPKISLVPTSLSAAPTNSQHHAARLRLSSAQFDSPSLGPQCRPWLSSASPRAAPLPAFSERPLTLFGRGYRDALPRPSRASARLPSCPAVPTTRRPLRSSLPGRQLARERQPIPEPGSRKPCGGYRKQPIEDPGLRYMGWK